VLPLGAARLQLLEATGEDELVVLEPADHPVTTLLRLASRLAVDSVAGEPVAWDDLPAADLGAVALAIRRAWLGDIVRTEGFCSGAACRERMDITFAISSYLAHHRPRPFRGVLPGRAAGWFELTGCPASFRLPTIGDLRAAVSAPDPELFLRQRCVNPASVSSAVARRISRAMDALAPSLDGPVTAQCPACGDSVVFHFDPLTYALAELQAAAGGLYEDVHLLASAFGWPEHDILAMPRQRRARYAALLHDQRIDQRVHQRMPA
jgi:hypothetical protein